MDIHSQSKSMVLAARRPLSYDELSAAVDCMSSEQILGDVLEVSGGIRPVVHFKVMTALGGSEFHHGVAARCCLRTLQRDYLCLDGNNFLRYAIEFALKHADCAGPIDQADFMKQFDYEKWQRWAVLLPVYAALDTYSFEGAMLRLKCFRLLRYVSEYHRHKLDSGVPGSRRDVSSLRYSISPWRGDFETRRRQRQQQRDLLLGIGPSWRTPSGEPTPELTLIDDIMAQQESIELIGRDRESKEQSSRDSAANSSSQPRLDAFSSGSDRVWQQDPSEVNSRHLGSKLQRGRELGVTSSGWTPWDDARFSRLPTLQPLVDYGLPSLSANDASSSSRPLNAQAPEFKPSTPPSPALSALTLTTTDALSQSISPTMSTFSFENVGASEADLSDFELLDLETGEEALPWEDIEDQEVILASLQQDRMTLISNP